MLTSAAYFAIDLFGGFELNHCIMWLFLYLKTKLVMLFLPSDVDFQWRRGQQSFPSSQGTGGIVTEILGQDSEPLDYGLALPPTDLLKLPDSETSSTFPPPPSPYENYMRN